MNADQKDLTTERRRHGEDKNLWAAELEIATVWAKGEAEEFTKNAKRDASVSWECGR